MERKSIERYLGRSVEIMLMPDGSEKTSGILESCEDDHIVVGDELLDYRMILRIRAVNNTAAPVHAPAPAPLKAPAPAPVIISPVKPSPFDDLFRECIDDMQKVLDTEKLSPDYVRKFRPNKPDKVFTSIEGILSKYHYAVKAHEDKPYSARMREILSASRLLWKSNRENIAAAEIYGFVLYLVEEGAKSAKVYRDIGDFYAAFIVSPDASARALASACAVVSETMNVKNFAPLLRAGHPQLISMLRWIIANILSKPENSETYREFCFEHAAALAWKLLGFTSWANHERLFTQENINALRAWLEVQKCDEKIIDEAISITEKFKTPSDKEENKLPDLNDIKFQGEINYFNRNRNKLLGFIECPELKKYNLRLKSEGFIFFHINQVEDRELRRQLLLSQRMKPDIKVTFKVGRNEEGPSAYEIWEQGKSSAAPVLKVDMSEALTESGEIEFFSRYSTPPFGKVRAKDGKLYTFNGGNIIDPMLAVFLEYTPSVEGHPVYFIKTTNDDGRVQIRNLESAVKFSEDKIRAWEREGLIQRANDKMTSEEYQNENDEGLTGELEDLINRSYIPLDSVRPEDYIGNQTAKPEEHNETTIPVKILEVHASIVKLMKRELSKIFNCAEESLDGILKIEIPLLNSEEYENSIQKTRRTYSSDAGLLDVLPINVLGNIMGRYWRGCFDTFFGGKSYENYWKERFAKLQWVRNALAHAHPEYLTEEDYEQAGAIITELKEYF